MHEGAVVRKPAPRREAALATLPPACNGASRSWNFALTNDVLAAPGDVGGAFAFVTLDGDRVEGAPAALATRGVVGVAPGARLASPVA